MNSRSPFAGVALHKKSLKVFFACLCLEMLCHHPKTAFQYSAGSARSGIPQAFVMICWNIWNWFVVTRYELILVILVNIDVDICAWKWLLYIEQAVRRCCVLSHPFLFICSSQIDLRNFEYIILAYAPLQYIDNTISWFCRNIINYAFVTGSGEADTTGSSFTTSAEQPLETTTSDMTGLLLIKINFSSCQGQWHPRCRNCRRFKNVTGVSGNKVFDCKKTAHFSSQNHVLVILLHSPI